MSYSRWSCSEWYTYWSCPLDEEKETRDTAIFSVCMIADFTAKQLRDNMDQCIEDVKRIVEKEYKDPFEESHYTELRGYMERFLSDVDEEYMRDKK